MYVLIFLFLEADMGFFEAGMLVCFGAAWPLSIYKSAVSKSTKGKSFVFMIVILLGYASGMLHKIFVNNDWVIVLYILNFVMVSIDVLLYLRNKRLEEKAGLTE